MESQKFLQGESDIFIGKRRRLKRYLVCAMEGYFPVLAKLEDDSLAVVFRTGGPHIGIAATLSACVSKDGGKCWSDPVDIAHRWEDVRNPAMGINDKGEIVIAYWKALLQAYRNTEQGPAWSPEEEAKTVNRTDPAHFVTLSSDCGRTWSAPEPIVSHQIVLVSTFGRIISAPDGTLLMPAYGLLRDSGDAKYACVVLRSSDGGRSWGDESIVAPGHNEFSLAFMPDQTLVGALRSVSGHVAVTRSADLGRTWTKPVQITRDGEHPADLTCLHSGTLLMTFGRRIRPFGCGALLSDDGGKTWNLDGEVLLAGDGEINGDLGYPSTVQLKDGTIVTVLYYANGSEMSNGSTRGWGYLSCQAIHYREDIIR